MRASQKQAREVSGAELEIPGMRLPSDTYPTVEEFFGGLTGSGGAPAGLPSKLARRRRPSTLCCSVSYGRSIPQLAEALHNNVIQHVENLTGLKAIEASITLKDVFLPKR